MTCAVCGREISDRERTAVVWIGALCEVCLDKADQCAPGEENNANAAASAHRI